MKDQPVNDGLLRQFLLGKVDDEERQRIETLFLTDPQSREKVLAVEQDLIEDYLDDSLSTSDRERFLLHYAGTPVQRRKLRIAKTVQDWATEAGSATSVAPSIWSRLRERIQLKPVVVIPIAVTAMIAIIVAAVWINGKREHLRVEQELARLNAPSNAGELPPQMLLELAPISVRSVETQNEIVPRSDVRVVELRLLWTQKEHFTSYQAVVHRFSDDNSFTIPNLQSENDGGYKIRIRFPAHMLKRGLYQILLSGVAADGTVRPAEEYTFSVGT